MEINIGINLPEGVSQRFQQAKHFVNQSVNSLSQSAHQVGESWKQTATTATDKAIDTVTTSLGQAKGSLEQSLQTADQIKSTTSSAIETAVASSVNDWLVQHPAIFRLVQILAWATNHPIISLVILLFVIAIAGSIIKAIVRLIETASWSILQVPFKLLVVLSKASFLAFIKIGNLSLKELRGAKTDNTMLALSPATYQAINKDKQQRLAEITARLEDIQKEQKELLEEAAEIIAVDTIDIKIKDVNT